MSQIDWNLQFDQATLKRANTYLRNDHLESLSLEQGRRGRSRLRALVRGSGGEIYEPWIEFINETKGGLSVTSSCDCPVQGPCKHQALVLLYAQRVAPHDWPTGPSVEPSPPPPEQDVSQALPGWLRQAMGEKSPAASVSLMPMWDHWISDLGSTDTVSALLDRADEDRRFGLILRDADGRLAVLPAWLRPGRGRTGGWVDPQPLTCSTSGPVPEPAGGWPREDAVALDLILTSGAALRRTDPIPINTAPLETALATLMQRHPVFWQRGSVELELGPDLPLHTAWRGDPDGSQTLVLDVQRSEPTELLRGQGYWYVQTGSRRFGRALGDRQLIEQVREAPPLLPEDVKALSERLRRLAHPALTLPHPRRLRTVQATPVPVLRMSVSLLDLQNRGATRGPLRVGVATLMFDYDGQRLEPSHTDRERVVHGEDVLEIERQRTSERRAETRLAALDLMAATMWSYYVPLRVRPFKSNQYILRPKNTQLAASPESWTATLRELREAGCRIEYAPDFPRDDVVEIEDWHADLEEVGNAWFDVSLGIDVEGQRIDLMPILRRVLADPDFPMRKPEGEADDAAWRVRLDENRSVRLPMARLRAMLEPLLEWVLSSEDGLRLHRTQAAALQRVSDDTGLVWRGGEALRARIEQLRNAPSVADAPDGFLAQLRPYQREGLAWLNFLSDAGLGGVLADDMGLGKTVQVLAHLLAEKQRGKLDLPALVVAPTSLVGNWRDEAARFAPDLRVLVLHGADRADRYESIPDSDLVITTYPLLPRDRDSLVAQQFSLLVMDEAQAIKNARSQAAQVVREIPAQRRLGMTGTPLENHLGELWAQFDAIEPGLLGSETTFTRTYRTPIEKHADHERQQRLNQRIGALLLRRRKEDVLDDLPPKTEIVRSLELVDGQRQLYETLRLTQHERVRESIAERGLSQSGIVVLDALLKLRQACCDPRLVKLDAARKVKESAKLDALLELLDNLGAENRRVLVFSQFATMLGLIAEALTQRRIKHLMLTGDTPSTQRADLVRSFQEGKVPVFLISLKAGGVGLNLTAADTVIHYDPWWNPAVEAQATDRAHRIGQDKPIFVYKLICAGTVEEKIQAMQERKAELARAVLEGGSSTALRFDEADLAELFGPL
ncbi:MAG TPA: DEAD/DEAH box helicase [Chiayiivirga sp.]|nr:DEAD/DEAH box helicase [Chiayiivirga sp.]